MLAKNLPFHTFAEWMEAGYNWRVARCRATSCGLRVIHFYLPNDPPFVVDPLTYEPHAKICGTVEIQERRAKELNELHPREGGFFLDRKSLAAGER